MWKSLPEEGKKVFYVVGLIIFMYLLIPSSKEDKPAVAAPDKVETEAAIPESRDYPISGDNGVLLYRTMGGREKKHLDEANKAIRIKDEYGLVELVVNGNGYDLSEGTRIKVLETSMSAIKIRVLSGSDTGVACWVLRETIRIDI